MTRPPARTITRSAVRTVPSRWVTRTVIRSPPADSFRSAVPGVEQPLGGVEDEATGGQGQTGAAAGGGTMYVRVGRAF